MTLRLWRVIRRTWRTYGETRPDIGEGCPERFNLQTLDFWWYILRTYRSFSKKVETLIGLDDPRMQRISNLSDQQDLADELMKSKT